jgi:hypothetical protein
VNESRSLLTFLPVPIAVGDPDGRAVYVNPAFGSRFDVEPGVVPGRPLAELFDGGGREAVLGATARVCGEGCEMRFRLRERERGYAVVAAPIRAEDQIVGLLFLFWDEAVSDERLLSFGREIARPLDDLEQCLDALLEQTGGRRAERFRSQVEDGMRSVVRIRKWTDEITAEASYAEGSAEAAAEFDALVAVQAVVEAVADGARAAGQTFDVLLPAGLPLLRGDGDRLSVALEGFVRARVSDAPRGTAFTLTAKLLESEGCVLLSVTEVAPAGAGSFALDDDAPPGALERVIAPWGGAIGRVADPVAGVTTSLRLPAA